jgi:hypothetical protein
MQLKLEARALKVSTLLDPAVLIGVEVPNGLSKATLLVAVAGRTVTAEVNAKSLRRAVTTIAAEGPDAMTLLLQGKLEGNVILEAGIAAQPKAQKATAAT